MASFKCRVLILLASFLLSPFSILTNALSQPIGANEEGSTNQRSLSDAETSTRLGLLPSSTAGTPLPSPIRLPIDLGRRDIENEIINRREFNAEVVDPDSNSASKSESLDGPEVQAQFWKNCYVNEQKANLNWLSSDRSTNRPGYCCDKWKASGWLGMSKACLDWWPKQPVEKSIPSEYFSGDTFSDIEGHSIHDREFDPESMHPAVDSTSDSGSTHMRRDQFWDIECPENQRRAVAKWYLTDRRLELLPYRCCEKWRAKGAGGLNTGCHKFWPDHPWHVPPFKDPGSNVATRSTAQRRCMAMDVPPIWFFNDKNAAKIEEHRQQCLCWEREAKAKSLAKFMECKSNKAQPRPGTGRQCILARDNLSGCCDAHIQWEGSLESKGIARSAMSDECSCFWPTNSGRPRVIKGCQEYTWLRVPGVKPKFGDTGSHRRA